MNNDTEAIKKQIKELKEQVAALDKQYTNLLESKKENKARDEILAIEGVSYKDPPSCAPSTTMPLTTFMLPSFGQVSVDLETYERVYLDDNWNLDSDCYEALEQIMRIMKKYRKESIKIV